MKKIIINDNDENTKYLSEISLETPIFVKESGKLIGMIIKNDNGWIVSVGADIGAYGYFRSRELLIRNGMKDFTYEFFVED